MAILEGSELSEHKRIIWIHWSTETTGPLAQSACNINPLLSDPDGFAVELVRRWNEHEKLIRDRDALLLALKAIADNEGQCCSRCEGNGRLWSDGKAHLPSYNGPTTACPNCDGKGRTYPDIQQIALDTIAQAEQVPSTTQGKQ